MKTKPISLRVSDEELTLWKIISEIENYRTLADFVIECTHSFLHQKPLNPEIGSRDMFQKIKKNLISSPDSPPLKTSTISLRIPLNFIKEWDAHCNFRHIPRISLIRQALKYYFDTDFQNEDLFLIPSQKLLNKIIQRMGSLDYDEIASIFEGLNPNILNNMLNSMETRGIIGRKGGGDRKIYVSASPLEVLVNPLLLSDTLSLITHEIEINPEIFFQNLIPHSTFVGTFFTYLKTFLKVNSRSYPTLSEHLSNPIIEDYFSLFTVQNLNTDIFQMEFVKNLNEVTHLYKTIRHR